MFTLLQLNTITYNIEFTFVNYYLLWNKEQSGRRSFFILPKAKNNNANDSPT